MDLLTATQRIKNALSTRDFIAELTHYHMREGRIYAANGAITASAPIDESLEYVVPASEMDKALSIFGSDAKFEWAEDSVVIKKARKKMTIRLLKPDHVALIEPTPNKFKVSSNFVSSIKKIRPFISDDASRPWALTAWLHKGPHGLHVWTATNNIAVVEVDAETEDDTIETLFDCQVPNFALDFVVGRQQKLTHMGQETNRVSFFFEDDSVLTTQLFAIKMPDQVPNIIAGCYEEEKFDEVKESFKLDKEWKDSYRELIQLGAEEVMLGPDYMSAGKKQATIEIQTPTTAPRDTTKIASFWNPKFLTPVVEIAEVIDFANYPNASPFYGPGMRGLIIGKIV